MSDPRRNRAQLVIGALIAAVAVAGCGAGQITQTSRQVAAVEGAGATAGQISVRNAMIEFDEAAHGAAIYPIGGSAPLQMVIVNTGAEVDRLVAASSPVAESVEISGVLRIPGGQALTVEGAPAALTAPVPAQATPGATPGAAPSTSAPTTAPSATAPSTTAPSTSTPPTGAPAAAAEPAPAAPPAAQGEPGAGNIVLTGLREDVQAGLTYPLILTFERAGEVRFDVPVANPDTLREDGHA